MAIRDEFLITRSGRTFALFAGLLDAGHREGLKSINTELIQVPNAENGNVAICRAMVEMEDGRSFTGYGDASPENVTNPKQIRLIAMSETRSKARSLRDAVNASVSALEDLSDEDPTPTPTQARPEHSRASEEQQQEQAERTPGGATKKAADYLIRLLIDAGHDEEKVRQFVPQMKAADVSKKIKEYQSKGEAG